MNIFSKSIASVLLISFVGCSALQNLSANEIRQEKNFYKKVTLKKSIKEIQNALYVFNYNCRPTVPFKVKPSNPQKALMLFRSPGFTEMSVMCVLDFKEITEDSTILKTYSYYSTWHGKIDRLIQAIKQPKACH